MPRYENYLCSKRLFCFGGQMFLWTWRWPLVSGSSFFPAIRYPGILLLYLLRIQPNSQSFLQALLYQARKMLVFHLILLDSSLDCLLLSSLCKTTHLNSPDPLSCFYVSWCLSDFVSDLGVKNKWTWRSMLPCSVIEGRHHDVLVCEAWCLHCTRPVPCHLPMVPQCGSHVLPSMLLLIVSLPLYQHLIL